MADLFPFFIGAARSGTTLIREIFDSHSQLAIPRDAPFVMELAARRKRYEKSGGFDTQTFLDDLMANGRFQRWNMRREQVIEAVSTPTPSDYPAAIRRLYELYARRQDKPRYADKTPRFATEMEQILVLFPEARFIHAIRDGRDVALSQLEVPGGPETIEAGAMFWRRRVEAARMSGARLPKDRYFEFRHEDLVAEPERLVKEICSFIELDYEPGMLNAIPDLQSEDMIPIVVADELPAAEVRDWRRQMDTEDVRRFELLAGDLLAELGYERKTDVLPLGPGARQALLRSRGAARAGKGGGGKGKKGAGGGGTTTLSPRVERLARKAAARFPGVAEKAKELRKRLGS